jgi:hypothetical protein
MPERTECTRRTRRKHLSSHIFSFEAFKQHCRFHNEVHTFFTTINIYHRLMKRAKPSELPDDFPFEPEALSRDALLAALAKHEYWFAPIPIVDWNFKVRPGEISDPEEALVAKNRLN